MSKTRPAVEIVRKLLNDESTPNLDNRLDDVLDDVFRSALQQAGILDPNDEGKYWDVKMEASVRLDESEAELQEAQDMATPVMDHDYRQVRRILTGMAADSRKVYMGGDHTEITAVQDELFKNFVNITHELNKILTTKGNIAERTVAFFDILNYDFSELLRAIYVSNSEGDQSRLVSESVSTLFERLDKLVSKTREGDAKPPVEGKIIPFSKK